MILDQSPPWPRRPAAFTLIELLAVIVIVSLVAGVATMGLAATSDAARLHAAAAQWRDLDAKARLFSRSLGPVEISLGDDGEEIQLHRLQSEELLSKLSLPPGMTGRIHAPGAPPSIVVDRLGRSIDYEVELRSQERVVAWQVCGLTGLITEAEP